MSTVDAAMEAVAGDSAATATAAAVDVPQTMTPSQERLLDAEEIEKVAATLVRPTARMHLESLCKKLRRESDALRRVEASSLQAGRAEKDATAAMDVDDDEKKLDDAPTPSPVVPLPTPAAPVAIIPPSPVAAAARPSGIQKYVPIDRFAFDAGGYNTPFVTLYVDLPGVGSIPRDSIHCNFQKDSIDLVVNDLKGKSYRLFKDSLEKDLDVDKCKIIVKSDKIVVKLAKVKGEYGSYDYWSKLTDPKKLNKSIKGKDGKEDPSAGIMDLMKQMYEEGDDNMRKVIGETMLKQRNGELNKPDPMKDFDSGMDDF